MRRRGLSIVAELKLGVIWLVMMPLRALGPDEITESHVLKQQRRTVMNVCVEELPEVAGSDPVKRMVQSVAEGIAGIPCWIGCNQDVLELSWSDF